MGCREGRRLVRFKGRALFQKAKLEWQGKGAGKQKGIYYLMKMGDSLGLVLE